MLHQGGSTIGKQEIAVAEAPKDADTRQSNITSCRKVNIAVANVDGRGGTATSKRRGNRDSSKLAEGSKNRVRSRFLSYASGFVLANSYRDFWEEMPHEFLRNSHHLIADNSHLTSASVKLMDKFWNTIVGSCGVERVMHVILSESVESSIELRIRGATRYGTFHEQADTVAHKMAHVIHRAFGHVVLTQGVIDTSSLIL